VQELLVWLPELAPKVWHDLPESIRSRDSITSFKRTLKCICSIRYLHPDSPPIHCGPSLNACLDSRACNVDVNLT